MYFSCFMVAHIFKDKHKVAGDINSLNLFVFFLKVIMLHFKLKGMEHGVPCKHILCPYTHPRPLRLGQNCLNIFFSESSRVEYQIRGNHRTSQKHIFCPYTHP